MKPIANSLTLDSLTFFGLLLGIGLLVVGFLAEEWRIAVPAMFVMFPSLLWGMR
jgi:hypothetical protein